MRCCAPVTYTKPMRRPLFSLFPAPAAVFDPPPSHCSPSDECEVRQHARCFARHDMPQFRVCILIFSERTVLRHDPACTAFYVYSAITSSRLQRAPSPSGSDSRFVSPPMQSRFYLSYFVLVRSGACGTSCPPHMLCAELTSRIRALATAHIALIIQNQYMCVPPARSQLQWGPYDIPQLDRDEFRQRAAAGDRRKVRRYACHVPRGATHVCAPQLGLLWYVRATCPGGTLLTRVQASNLIAVRLLSSHAIRALAHFPLQSITTLLVQKWVPSPPVQ